MSSYRPVRLLNIVTNRHFWIILVMFAIGIILHYSQQLGLGDYQTAINFPGLTRHAVERLFFLIPVTYAGLVFGIRGGITCLVTALVIMLPRVIFISEYPADALLETIGITVFGAVLNLWFEGQRKEKIRYQDIIGKLETVERELRSSEERYRYLFENASDAMWVHDMEGNIIAANKACEKLTGYSHEELLMMRCKNLIGKEEYFNLTKEVSSRLVEEESREQPYEQRLVKKDGTERIVNMTTSIVTDKDRVNGLQHIARDVTEEKRMEEMLSKITDGSPIPAFVINKQHQVSHWNMALNTLSGIKSEDIIGTDRQWQAFYSDKRPTMADLILDGASTEEIGAFYHGKYTKSSLIDGAYEVEDFFPDLGTEGKWLHFTASPIIDEDGEISAAIETLQDITEEKRLQENMQYYTQLITKAQEEERRRLARELHDEASPPLLLLLQRLDSIISDNKLKSSKALKNNLEDLREQAMEALDGVRNYAQDLGPRILDDLGLLPALEWMAENLEKEYGIDTSVEIKGDQRSISPEMELLLFRIVQEALSNTRRHAQALKAWIAVEYSDRINITVSDNGKGFDLPQRVEDLAGYGKLGLLGAQERARLIGGKLTIKSVMGKGTTISIEAPI